MADPTQRSVEARNDIAALLAFKVGLALLILLGVAGAAAASR